MADAYMGMALGGGGEKVVWQMAGKQEVDDN